MNDQSAEKVLNRVPSFLKKVHGWVRDGDGGATIPGDTGERARLKRARSGPEAYAFEATSLLFPVTAGSANELDDEEQELIGCLAILLAQVRGEVGEKTADDAGEAKQARGKGVVYSARHLGEMAGKDKESGGSPRLARLRFGRMLRAHKPDDRLRVFRDLLALLGIKEQTDFDRRQLAEIFLRWHQPRVQFAFARGYFAALNREQSTPDAQEMQPTPELPA